MQMLMKFLAAEQGATAIEYALIASIVSISIVGGVTGIGTALNDTFALVAAGFK